MAESEITKEREGITAAIAYYDAMAEKSETPGERLFWQFRSALVRPIMSMVDKHVPMARPVDFKIAFVDAFTQAVIGEIRSMAKNLGMQSEGLGEYIETLLTEATPDDHIHDVFAVPVDPKRAGD